MSDARRGEREAQVSEERLRLAQRVSRMGTWEWDVGSNEVNWSQELKPRA